MSPVDQKLLRDLPRVDESVALVKEKLSQPLPVRLVTLAVREVVAEVREALLAQQRSHLPSSKEWERLFLGAVDRRTAPRLRSVLNATGVVIHTNLGRSVLPEDASHRLVAAAGGYTNLEFDLNTGSRGSRYALVEEMLCELTGAESALVVNNNAAAVLLALNTLASGREVIVSRGQLVEIGGSFRIPDVMEKSGAALVEVGATNRTHLFDYEQAISAETALLLRVHASNFKVIGFTSEVSSEQMAALARRHRLQSMEDLGSGSLVDFSRFGLPEEPTVQQTLKAGVDVVTFSGDKLLGGPQAGIIAGKKDIVSRIKKNPLNRALRIDKFTLASLEAVLHHYYDLEDAVKSLPVLRMLTQPRAEVEARCRRVLDRLGAVASRFTLVPVESRVGGGAMPEYAVASMALRYDGPVAVSRLERGLRSLDVPIIGRVEDGHLLFDMRTVQESEEELFAKKAGSFLLLEERRHER